MRIGIDARFYGPRVGSGGLGRYVEKLVRHLEKLDRENEYIIFLGKENWNDYTPTAPNFKKVLAPWRWYTLAEQFGMPRAVRKSKLNLLHVPHFNIPIFSRVPLVVTIHDLILLEYPSIRATTLDPIRFWLKFIGYRIVISIALRRARKVIAVSEATRQAILKRFPWVPEKKVVTIYSSYTPSFISLIKGAKIITSYWLPVTGYLLTVGNAYPHKNLDTLLRAFKLYIEVEPPLPEIQREVRPHDMKLVLVGPDDAFRARLRKLTEELNLKDQVIFTGFVSEQTLDELYHGAMAYIVPSLLEGFAFPGLEAQSRGVPVLASDIAAHREAFGESAHYFNPLDPKDIGRAISDIISDITEAKLLANESGSLASVIQTKGFANIKRFSWEKTAREVINIYKTCVK